MDEQTRHTTSSRGSMRAAINAMCKSCLYDPVGGNGTWRQQVEACTSLNCPLYSFRPVSATAADDAGE